MAATPTPGGVQGEGDYASARKFQADEHEFVKSGQVEKKAREAEQALDGPEGAELEAAREAAAKGESLKAGHPDHVHDHRDPHVEDIVDRGLEDTFPASDPLSTSPGAD